MVGLADVQTTVMQVLADRMILARQPVPLDWGGDNGSICGVALLAGHPTRCRLGWCFSLGWPLGSSRNCGRHFLVVVAWSNGQRKGPGI